jgi:uncharacterized Zn-binding protein involved in type VI secretion
MGQKIGCVGDGSSHGGTIVSSNQDGTLKASGDEVAVDGALHSCPIPDHGITAITPITTKSYHNGKLIVTEGAVAGCGAVIQPDERQAYVE